MIYSRKGRKQRGESISGIGSSQDGMIDVFCNFTNDK